MVRVLALLLALSIQERLAACPRVVVDGSLLPAVGLIQGVGPTRRVVQTFPLPPQPVSCVEVLACAYPGTRDVPLHLELRVQGRCVASGTLPVRERHLVPVRLCFPPLCGEGDASLELWSPETDPGVGVSVACIPSPQGGLTLAGGPLRSDLVVRLMAPPSQPDLEEGFDLLGQGPRFPSPPVTPHEELVQRFVVPRDSLMGVRVVPATEGACSVGLAWSLSWADRTVRSGHLAAVADNVPQTITFSPLVGVRDTTLCLSIRPLEPNHRLRLWLCPGSAHTEGLFRAGNPLAGALVMATLHPASRPDSVRVVWTTERALEARPSGVLVEGTWLTQTLTLTHPTTPSSIGFRLALGGRIVAGSLVCELTDALGTTHRDTVHVAGMGKDQFVWFRLGPCTGPHLSVTLRGTQAQAELAPQVWWVPVDAYPGGEASGCVPPGGDCVFRLAHDHTCTQWVNVVWGQAPALLGARVAVLALACMAWAARRLSPTGRTRRAAARGREKREALQRLTDDQSRDKMV